MNQLESGDIVEARFEVEFCAGVGGMGRVYRCRDDATGQSVALKVMSVVGDAHRERFAREVRMLSDLKHPGIVRYLAHGELTDSSPYLVMEWIDGTPLGSRVCGEPLGLREALGLFRRLCEAVGVAHGRHIVHRDLKPANIILQDGKLDSPKVLDFGLARGIDNTNAITRTGTMVGTPAYMAPEQARKSSGLDARADVFALGCLMFECLTGYPAFRGPTVVSVLCKVLLDDPPRLDQLRADVPSPLADLVASMLAKDAEERPQNAGEVLQMLNDPGYLDADRVPVRPSIGVGEQRFQSVILAGRPYSNPESGGGTTALGTPRLRISVHRALEAFDASIDHMIDGTAVITLRGRGTATDRAARAGRCALAVRDLMPKVPVVLATGRGTVNTRQPAGEVIDAAAALLQQANDASLSPDDGGPILVDAVTSSLLDAHFDKRRRGDHIELLSYRASSSEPRKLLGRETPCVGRTRELATLRAVWEECAGEGVARPVVVTGSGGIGKTRLMREWLSEIARNGPQAKVFCVRADPMGTGGAFGMVGRLVRTAVGAPDTAAPELTRARIRARVEQLLPASEVERVSAFLADMVDVPAVESDDLVQRAARHDPVLRGDQIRRAFSDWLAAEVAAQPVVLVLEDMHWGDPQTVEILDTEMRARPEQPLCILALARPEIDTRFPRLWAERDVTTFALGPLRKRASIQLVCAALDDVGDARASVIADRAGGNPFFLEELIRAASEGRWARAPDTVLAMLQGRLDEFAPSVRRVLRAGSIFGDAFSAAAVAALLDEDATGLPEHCATLVDRELLLADPGDSGVRDFSFSQSLWREATYASLTETDRRVGHGLAGAWLEAHRPHQARSIAEHYDLGGMPQKAGVWYTTAARQALEGGDYSAALDRSEKGVASGAPSAPLRLMQAEAHKWRGENRQAADRAREALDGLPPGTPQWFAAAGEAAAANGKLGRPDALAAVAGLLRDAEPLDEGACAARTIALSRTATQLVLAGGTDMADVLLAMLANAETDPAVAGWVCEAQAVRAGSNQDPAARVQLAERAAQYFDAAGDRRNACLQHTSVGFALNEVGSFARARGALERALELGQGLDLTNAVSTARAQLGRALGRLGEYADAERQLRHAIVALGEQNNQRLQGVACSYLAWVMQETARLPEAEGQARRAVSLLGGAPSLKASASAMLARVLLGQKKVQEATTVAGEAGATLLQLGSLPTGESLVCAMVVETLWGGGDSQAAHTAASQARGRLDAQLTHMDDAEMKTAFLAMPEHARIFELTSAS